MFSVISYVCDTSLIPAVYLISLDAYCTAADCVVSGSSLQKTNCLQYVRANRVYVKNSPSLSFSLSLSLFRSPPPPPLSLSLSVSFSLSLSSPLSLSLVPCVCVCGEREIQIHDRHPLAHNDTEKGLEG